MSMITLLMDILTPAGRANLLHDRHRAGALGLVGLGVLILASTAIYAVAAADGMPRCGEESAVLAYPRYNKKGLIEDYTYRCGKPDGSCRARVQAEGEATIYDCSPFALGRKNAVM